MATWHNYGDIGYLDEGGVQVKDTDNESVFDIILLVQHPDDDDKMFAGHTTIDVTDYQDNERLIDCVKDAFGNTSYSKRDFAAIIAENEGLIELSMTAFNQNGPLAAYSMNFDAYEIDKLSLGKVLIDIGINDDIMLTRVKELSENDSSYD